MKYLRFGLVRTKCIAILFNQHRMKPWLWRSVAENIEKTVAAIKIWLALCEKADAEDAAKAAHLQTVKK